MKTQNFIKIINSITGREFTIDSETIELESEYFVYKILPINKTRIGFKFKTPKKEEFLIKAFITQFTSKYLEPNPKHYNGMYCGRPSGNKWEDMSDETKEFTYWHHRSRMFSKEDLLEQIKENAIKNDTEVILSRYGFYPTNYGIGLYVLFGFNNATAVVKMKQYLESLEIPYTNEFSNARWVYRFVINVNKDIHRDMLNTFNRINY